MFKAVVLNRGDYEQAKGRHKILSVGKARKPVYVNT